MTLEIVRKASKSFVSHISKRQHSCAKN